MVRHHGFSNGFAMLARTACCLAVVLGATVPAAAQSRFIRYPWQVTAAEGDRIPPSWYGYPLNDRNPTYFGGLNSREYYAYGRGYGIADFPGRVPPVALGTRLFGVDPNCVAPIPGRPYSAFTIPDKQPTFSSYPEDGRYFWQPGKIVPEAAIADVPVARFVVEVPTDAVVFIEGAKTNQTGASRNFVSPPLPDGKTYQYEIRATWKEDGQEVDQKQTIGLKAGSQLTVKFPMPAQPASFPLPNAE